MAVPGNSVYFVHPFGAVFDWGYRFISIPVSISDIFLYPCSTGLIEAGLGLSIWLTGGIDLCVSKVSGKLKPDWGYQFVEKWYRS